MSALLRRLSVTVAAAALVVAPAASAAGADGTIAHVEGTDEGLQVVVSVPTDAEVDVAGVEVTLDGRPAEAVAEVMDSDIQIERTTVLAIDTSNSMKGGRFDAAKQAALTFVDSVPADVLVGIVTFDSEVDEAMAPTIDREQARAVIESLSLERDTLLYDGVIDALEMAGTEGQRSVLVLSDGADTGDTEIDSVTAAIEASGALVDVVALEQDPDQIEPLQQLAGAGRGQVISADSDALGSAFSAEAEVLANQVLVTAQIPNDVTAPQASVEVTLPSSAGDVVASAYSTIQQVGEAPTASSLGSPPAPEQGRTAPAWALYAGIGVFALGLLVAALMLVPAQRRLTEAERIMAYSRTGGAPAAEPDSDVLAGAKQAMEGVLERNSGLNARITHRLEAAGSELRAPEWLLLHAAIFVGSGFLGLLLGQGDPVIGIVFLALGAVGPWVYLVLRQKRRRKAFHAALPDTLQLISGSLAAGLSLTQSLDTVVREGTEPVASEFKRVLVETRLGVHLEDALDGLTERFESKDFEWIVMAIRIQRQVGGNLAQLLDTVAGTMREREYLRRQVMALSAEGRLSAVVLGGLPPIFLLYLTLTQRDYVMPLFTDTRGIFMIVGAGVWLTIGGFWMSKLVKVEV